jgi:hypothetical protein
MWRMPPLIPEMDRYLIPEDAMMSLPEHVRGFLRANWTYIVTTPDGVYFDLPTSQAAELQALLPGLCLPPS